MDRVLIFSSCVEFNLPNHMPSCIFLIMCEGSTFLIMCRVLFVLSYIEFYFSQHVSRYIFLMMYRVQFFSSSIAFYFSHHVPSSIHSSCMEIYFSHHVSRSIFLIMCPVLFGSSCTDIQIELDT